VVTGHPGHGKTALMMQIWYHIVKTYEVPFLGHSVETKPRPHIRRQLRTLYCGEVS
jgi:twinkle protein